MMSRLSLIVCFLMAASATAFAPATTHPQFQRARLISGSTVLLRPRYMSSNDDDSNSKAPASKAPQGTFYDDEVRVCVRCVVWMNLYCLPSLSLICEFALIHIQVNPDSYAPKVGISDSMRDRLKREASRGLDSEQKQPNIILYISVIVAILVAAAGSGILY